MTPGRLTAIERLGFPPRLSLATALAVLAVVVVSASFGQLLAPYDPNALDLANVSSLPSHEHLLGTDHLGRDVFSRLIIGSTTPLIGGMSIALGVAVIGCLIGIPAGYFGGLIDTVTMRWADLMISFPSLLVAIVLSSILGASPVLTICILILFAAPYEVRMMRGMTLDQKSLPYVEAAKTAGFSSFRIMARHVGPNVVPILVTDAFLNFALGLVGLTTLSFLGLGLPLGMPDWGRMVFEAREIIYDNPAAAVAPAVLISITAASAAIVGDASLEWFAAQGISR